MTNDPIEIYSTTKEAFWSAMQPLLPKMDPDIRRKLIANILENLENLPWEKEINLRTGRFFILLAGGKVGPACEENGGAE